MGAAARRERMTEAEYLVFEATSFEKHHFVNGELIAMAGARIEHNHTVMNVTRVLLGALGAGPCRVVGSDQRVHVEATGIYVYPDLAVWCGAPQIVGPNPKSLVNPTVLVEVLSESTEDDDRTWKSSHYRRIPTLQAYVLVDWQDRRIEVYARTPEGWLLNEVIDTGAVAVAAIGARLDCADVFAGLAELRAQIAHAAGDSPAEG